MKLSTLIAIGYLTLFIAAANAQLPTAAVDVLPADQPVKEVDETSIDILPVDPVAIDVVPVDAVLIDSKDLVPVDDGTGTHFEYLPISADETISPDFIPPVLKDDGTGTYYFPTMRPDDGTSDGTTVGNEVIYYAMMSDVVSDTPVVSTPEPATWVLLATAGAVGYWRRPRSKLPA